ncbi:uncharacterized protein LOC131226900 [Magnolia sinica]|uniref:uncharacterized protein LOC131226900 n=1 Tax=Magnolia sinica TaxID=86752 RepID=UPI002658D136|nr:uncharacterized protein LOC131226900 [Magnolia sinica]
MDPMDNALVDALVEQVNLGRKSDIEFKLEAYKATITEIFDRCGVHIENKHISNRLRTLKRFYWAVQDMFNASGFTWDSEMKMVTATDNVWNGYIVSHPFAEKVYGKHIERYTDLTFMFSNDSAHGSFATTTYLSPVSDQRRSRNEFNIDSNSDDYETEIVRLSSNSGDDHDIGLAIRAHDGSQLVHRVSTVPVETSRGSKSTHLTAIGFTRQKRRKPSDVIGDRMGEVVEAVKSLTITMS